MKTGRLSKQEWDFIERNADKLSPELIAKQLERDIEPVLRYLRKIGKGANQSKNLIVQAEYDLKARPYWREIKQQFSEDELELFLYHWKQIVAQFRKDVLPTEELQIVDTIKLEVLMNRTLREQQETMTRVRELEAELEVFRRLPHPEQDREQIFSHERAIASFRAAKQALGVEYEKLQTKKAALYKDLKATRAERIHKIENSKTTLSGLIDRILKDPEFYETEGKNIERMRLAMEYEKKRLGDYHEYEDGIVDQPLLTPENVID